MNSSSTALIVANYGTLLSFKDQTIQSLDMTPGARRVHQTHHHTCSRRRRYHIRPLVHLEQLLSLQRVFLPCSDHGTTHFITPMAIFIRLLSWNP